MPVMPAPTSVQRAVAPYRLFQQKDWGLRRRWFLPANPGAQAWLYALMPTVGGTAPSRPVFIITYPLGPDYGLTQLRIVNASLSPSPQITVIRTFSPGDVLIIDCDELSVEVNSTPVDFFGAFPLLDPRVGATNAINLYAWAASAPTLTPEIDWTPRFAA